MAKTKADEPAETFRLEVNGHKLTGEKRGGKWEWQCSVSGLAKKYKGASTTTEILAEFMRHAMAGSMTAKAFMATFDRVPAEQPREGGSNG